jgi:hypothetical protein
MRPHVPHTRGDEPATEAMCYTSIMHEGRRNYQSDFKGPMWQVAPDFELDCKRKGVVWAHLFEEKTGKIVAHYSLKTGFVRSHHETVRDHRRDGAAL